MRLIGLFSEYWELRARLADAERRSAEMAGALSAANDRVLALERRVDHLEAELRASFDRERSIYERVLFPAPPSGARPTGKLRATELVEAATREFIEELNRRAGIGESTAGEQSGNEAGAGD